LVKMTDNFKKWFGDSKVVDDEGNPLVVYHGTTHDFKSFELERGNMENAVGRGYYFTTSPEDASINYAGVGADLTQRITTKKENIEDYLFNYPDDAQTLMDKYGMSREEAESIENGEGDPDFIDTVAQREATKKFKGEHDGAVIPAYLKIDKPFDMDTEEKSITIEWDEEYYKAEAKDEVDEDDYDDEDEYREALDEKAREIYYEAYDPMQDGDGVELRDALLEVKNSGEYEGLDDEQVWDFETFLKENYSTPKEVYDKLREILVYAQDNESGALASQQIFNDVVKKAGYDGVIQDAHTEFGRARTQGQPMEGIEYGDLHYIVFEPTQIKSAIGNNGEYDPNNPDIVMKQGGQTKAQQDKIAFVMGEFKDGTLKSSSGDTVTNRKQAIAIALSEAGVEKKMYRGGDVTNYNRWKEIDWDSMPDGKTRSKIYRLLGWINDERLDLSKLKESTKEEIEEYQDEALSWDTYSYIIKDEVQEIEKEYELLQADEDIEDEKSFKKVFNSDEYKGLRERMAKYNISARDLDIKNVDAIVDDYMESTGYDHNHLVDYFLTDQTGWNELKDVYDTQVITDAYEEALESGAVFTEEAELAQYDMFAEPKEEPKEDDLSEIQNEIDSLEELRNMMSDDKDSVAEIDLELDALNDLKELISSENMKTGGAVKSCYTGELSFLNW
jgi:hypothetical protein